MRYSSYKFVNWYNQTLRFSCNDIVNIYGGGGFIIYEGCRHWKI